MRHDDTRCYRMIQLQDTRAGAGMDRLERREGQTGMAGTWGGTEGKDWGKTEHATPKHRWDHHIMGPDCNRTARIIPHRTTCWDQSCHSAMYVLTSTYSEYCGKRRGFGFLKFWNLGTGCRFGRRAGVIGCSRLG